MIDTSKEIPVSWSPLFQHSDDQSDGMYFFLEHLSHPGLEVYKFSPSSQPQDAIAMVPLPTAMVLNSLPSRILTSVSEYLLVYYQAEHDVKNL